MATSRYFQLIDGKSQKYWHISRESNSHMTTYGRIGSVGRSTTKTLEDDEKALAEFDKLIEQKLKKGYEEVPAKIGRTHQNENGH